MCIEYLCYLSFWYTETINTNTQARTHTHTHTHTITTHHLGFFPSSILLPSICSLTLTRSVGLARNWPIVPAIIPPGIAFLAGSRQRGNDNLRWRASNVTQPCNKWRRGFRFTALERHSGSCRGHPRCHATCLVPRLILGLY